jgi:hypothetical protein
MNGKNIREKLRNVYGSEFGPREKKKYAAWEVPYSFCPSGLLFRYFRFRHSGEKER